MSIDQFVLDEIKWIRKVLIIDIVLTAAIAGEKAIELVLMFLG